MTAPIPLTALQFAAIVNAAASLFPGDRDAFVAAVAAKLQGQLIGDGNVGCAIRECQSKFAHPVPEPLPPRWARSRPRYERVSRRF